MVDGNPSHTPISHGTNQRHKEGVDKEDSAIRDYIDKVIQPKINKVLQEQGITPEWVGSKQKNPTIKFNIQPHDCRLYFDFSKEGFHPKKPPEPTIRKIGGGLLYFNKDYTYKPANYGKEHHYFDFMGCTIMVKKEQIQLNINIHKKQWRMIEAFSIDDIDERIKEVLDNLNQHGIQTLKTFINLHGGASDFEIKRASRCEVGIHGHDYLDNMPEKLIIRDTYFKKLYREKIEIYEDMYKPAKIKNTMTNLIIKDLAPEIAKELGGINSTLLETLKIHKSSSTHVGHMITGMRPILMQITNLNKGFSDLNIRLTELQQQSKPPIPHISRELLFLMNHIKNPYDILKYKAKVILLNDKEKRMLEDYSFSGLNA